MSDPCEPAVWLPAVRAGSGADVFTKRLAEGLRQRGFQAEVTWLPHRAEYVPWTVASPAPPAWANIAHVNTWLPQRYLPVHLPVVATVHHCVHDDELARFKSSAQALYHRLWIKPMERAVLRRAARIVAVSRYAAERTSSVFRFAQMDVVHNGIDLAGAFRPGPIRPAHAPFRLLFVGNWSYRKGVDMLAPIMKTLGSDFQLFYTGMRVAEETDNMQCVGSPATSAELAAVYRNVDALVFPSRLEGFGLVPLEAQACGLPVIATNGSALPEVVEDGVTGILCVQDDVGAFAAAARKLAAEAEVWQRMGTAARARVERLFGMDAMLESYIAIYRAALGNHPWPGECGASG